VACWLLVATNPPPLAQTGSVDEVRSLWRWRLAGSFKKSLARFDRGRENNTMMNWVRSTLAEGRDLFGKWQLPLFSSVRDGRRKVRRVSLRKNIKQSASSLRNSWTPCHPSTAHRFKASMVCSHGHVLTLGSHSISANGDVWPSVVCPTPGCHFHEYVRLKGWTDGPL
jgi:hypothetical protein